MVRSIHNAPLQSFAGTTLDPQVQLLQPGGSIPYAIPTLNIPGGAPLPSVRSYLPGQYR